MHVVSSKENLLKGIQSVLRAVSSRGPLPILTHIKLEADASAQRPLGDPSGKGVLRLSATDLDVGLEAVIPAEVLESGAVAVSGRTFSEIVAKMPQAAVDLSVQESSAELTLRCQRSRFHLRGMHAREFPTLPRFDDASVLTLDAQTLLAGIRRTAFAIAGDDKGVISGLFVNLVDGSLELVATDGFRLAQLRTAVDTPSQDVSMVFPKRAIDELVRQLGHAGSLPVGLRLNGQQVAFSFPDRYMTMRLIDGTYPNYRQIIPSTFTREAILDRASLAAAVERVGVMASERESHCVKMEFNASGELNMVAGNQEVGDSQELLNCEYQGEPLTIHFNAAYLGEALKHTQAESVRLSMNTTLSPALIRSLEDDGHLVLLMPINRG